MCTSSPVSSGGKNVSMEGKVSPMDIYDRLWQCRDFELDHLWQRSVFLATFLTLCFVGYGSVVLKMMDNDIGIHHVLALNLIAIGLCVVGTLLSFLWMLMAKGSKYWYERQEHRISRLVHEFMVLDEVIAEKVDDATNARKTLEALATGEDWEKKSKEPIESSCCFSSEAARFSPSRINYAIGAVSGLLFFVIGAFHCLSHGILRDEKSLSEAFSSIHRLARYFTEWPMIGFVALTVLVSAILYKCCKSVK